MNQTLQEQTYFKYNSNKFNANQEEKKTEECFLFFLVFKRQTVNIFVYNYFIFKLCLHILTFSNMYVATSR